MVWEEVVKVVEKVEAKVVGLTVAEQTAVMVAQVEERVTGLGVSCPTMHRV